jgi:hypothetical protein
MSKKKNRFEWVEILVTEQTYKSSIFVEQNLRKKLFVV